MRNVVLLLLCVAACDGELAATCVTDEDCGGDLVCQRPASPDGGAVTGRCSYARRGPGETCATNAECESGLFCSNDVPTGAQQRFGECIERQGAGAACFRDDDCAAPLECVKQGEASDGTCAMAPADPS